MLQYFMFYTSANLMASIVFGIILAHDLVGVDRQEKQIKYDNVLIAFILYFISDSLWCGVDSGVFPRNMMTATTTCFLNYVNMSLIMISWLDYVLAAEQVEHRNRRINRIAVMFPFAIATIALIAVSVLFPGALLDEDYRSTMLYHAFLILVPYIYVIAVIIYTMRRAIHEDNPALARRHAFIGLFPVLVVIGGSIQTVFVQELPLFCYSGTILMFVFFLRSMDVQISTDPLTRLNNRGQLMRYVSQNGNLRIEGRPTYVVMLDINDFKKINDRYGHAEGDSALIITSQSLMEVVKNCNMPIFLARYGGDEFVLIVHPLKVEEIESILGEIRLHISEKCKKDGKPYILSVGIGYDEIIGEQDSFQRCLERADNKLYLDKEHFKFERAGI